MTRQIKIGNLKIGGRAPIVIQSMTKTDTKDASATIRQIKELESAGCELVRLAVKDFQSANAIKKIREGITIPLVADIHFDYRLAIAAIENGADKIRLNPGNIHKEEQVMEVARLAKKRRIPIRVGLNSGSIGLPSASLTTSRSGQTRLKANHLVKVALDYIKILEKAKFYDIIVSLKASDVMTTIEACRKFSKSSRYPLHLGVTAAGPIAEGLVKSSLGIGILLSEGIGDTIRVSLTGHPREEVIAAKNILQALGLRRFGPEIISCPTCGRCQVDLIKIVNEFEKSYTLYAKRHTLKTFPRIAIMGCEVNGPGEAKEADIGIAFGKGSGIIFKRGRIIKKVKEKDAIKEILRNTLYTLRKTNN
ncbi:MAG: flavodoxin-dependent (E)-4-hydroxy-3-methylbut-2-enyl-diphosphate synthase [Candidatus Omnitrophica bacterium]|nr:flavodoxin-dependent (E)-4-hydroxy-3-methylbut-2-enyl-diphosphate synthase [Candidatus Omnitrophota bacterium]MBU1933223.1 flavodoxin-dependent (E)-4-hydroxy-3-methylbut-2-enyl-diphosphate synthase [Candidatus Omnitrophota bacterium]